MSELPLTALMTVSDADCAVTILGVPLVEFQMRRAVALGAGHVVLLVERMPPALLAAADRVRREGVGVDLARSLADAIDFVHPADRVLLIAPKVHITGETAAALVAALGPAVVAQDATGAAAWMDIVGARLRWTGWAAFDGTALRAVGALIGDWDFAPTILRHLLQNRAEVIEAATAPPILDRVADRQSLARGAIAGAVARNAGLGARLVRNPAAALLARLGGEAGLGAVMGEGVALALAAIALILALFGFVALSFAVALLAGIAAHSALLLSTALGSRRSLPRLLGWTANAATAIVVLIDGVTLTRLTGQWGCLALVVTVIATAARLELGPPAAPSAARADTTSTLVILLVGALAGVPVMALGLAWLHLLASALWPPRALAPN